MISPAGRLDFETRFAGSGARREACLPIHFFYSLHKKFVGAFTVFIHASV